MASDLPSDRFRIKTLSCQDMLETLRRDAREGLVQAPRSLPPKYFYDETGSRLFNEICKTRDYYVTRTERELLEQHADEIIAMTGPRTCVELGAGTAVKTEILLSRLTARRDTATYVTIDVCEEVLLESARRLIRDFPGLAIESLAGEYLAGIDALREPEKPVLYIFLGSSLGNFSEPDSIELLSRVVRRMAPGDSFLLGLDRVKDKDVLERAYNDERGVTAQFNLNVLNVLNAQLGADFRLQAFSHRAVYREAMEQIEMHLVARTSQVIALPGIDEMIRLHAGEHILTEISRKYTRSSIQRLLSGSGLCEQAHFEPENGYFSLVLAKPVH